MALPAFAPDDEEVAGAGPGVAPVTPPPVMTGMPQMPGMPPAPPAPAGPALDPGAPPPGAAPDPNASLPPEALMQPGADLQPPAPAASPPIPLTPDGKVDVAAAEKNALAEQGQLQVQGEGAERAKGAAEGKIAEAESTAADKQAAMAAQQAVEQQKIVDTANASTQKWLDQAQQDAQKYRGMGLHDYWQDKSTGDKVLAGLSMLFGAAGKTQGGPENNPGMGMIERAVERDFRQQQANIEKARSNVAMDKEQYDLGMTAKQQALADSNLKKANAYDAAAAQLVSYKLKQQVPLAQANTDANVVALRQKALATRQETLQAIHAQNVADAHLDIERERADAYRAKMGRGRGGAGGGGSVDGAALKWTQWAESNPNASEADKKAKAVELHIPLNAKAGRTSYETLTKDLSNVAKTTAGAAKTQSAQDARIVHTPDGDMLAPNARGVEKYADQIAALKTYQDKAEELAKHIEKFGRIVNPYSEEGKKRLELTRDFQAQGRQVSKISPSNAGQQLEHEMIGGAGVGVERMASPAVVRHLAGMAYKQVQEKMKIGLTKLPMGGGTVTPQQRQRARDILSDPTKKAKLSNQELAAVVNAAGVM